MTGLSRTARLTVIEKINLSRWRFVVLLKDNRHRYYATATKEKSDAD